MYNSHFVGVAALNENPDPDEILGICNDPNIPDAAGDLPAFIVPYLPRTTTAKRPSNSTSTGLAAMPTIPSYRASGLFVGVAGAALVAAF
jgi:hypothetical protein